MEQLKGLAQVEISDYNNPLNILDKQIKNELAHFITAIPVEVVAVNRKNRTVDVVPMVHMVDHTGKSHKHSTIHNIPFMCMQGGNYGIICDPQIGDKGQMLINSRNIEKVKTTRDHAPPDNKRNNSLSDGVYIGNLFNNDPDIYIQLQSNGIEIKGNVTINGDLKVNGNVNITGDAIIGGISFKKHMHSNGHNGGNTGVPNG